MPFMESDTDKDSNDPNKPELAPSMEVKSRGIGVRQLLLPLSVKV